MVAMVMAGCTDADGPACGVAVDRCGPAPLAVDYPAPGDTFDDEAWRYDLNFWFTCVRFAAGEVII